MYEMNAVFSQAAQTGRLKMALGTDVFVLQPLDGIDRPNCLLDYQIDRLAITSGHDEAGDPHQARRTRGSRPNSGLDA